MLKELNRKALPATAPLPEKVVQFGGGNFLRAFSNWMIDRLNEERGFEGGVVVVKPTERGDYAALRKQDGLYHVVLKGIRQGELVEEVRLIRCISRIIHPYHEYDAFLATAEIPSIRFILSNTTEAGIVFREEAFPTERPPAEFPAKLTAWLYHRYRYFGGDAQRGCVMLPLELIEDNGGRLQACVLRCAAHWQLEEGFGQWLGAHNVFCNTLVDRIVSGYPAEEAAGLQARLGFRDELLVAGEHYHSWVIESPQDLRAELPFERTGMNVRFVDELRPYRELKVRLLNGAHTAMVPLGYLCGLETVGQVMQSAEVSSFIEALLRQEVAPTLDLPPEEVHAYIDEVLDRFRNPSIHHRLLSIALNSISKFRTRLLPSLLAYVERKGELPRRIVFALAALIRFYAGRLGQQPIPLRDEEAVLRFFAAAWQQCDGSESSLRQLAERVLGERRLWGKDLNELQGLRDQLSQYLSKNVTPEALKSLG